jgi:uncharacterized coiled-coil protein SlyX
MGPMTNKEDDYLKGYGMALVTLVNRINELEVKLAEIEEVVLDISENIDAATFLLKTFMDSQGHTKAADN